MEWNGCLLAIVSKLSGGQLPTASMVQIIPVGKPPEIYSGTAVDLISEAFRLAERGASYLNSKEASLSSFGLALGEDHVYVSCGLNSGIGQIFSYAYAFRRNDAVSETALAVMARAQNPYFDQHNFRLLARLPC